MTAGAAAIGTGLLLVVATAVALFVAECNAIRASARETFTLRAELIERDMRLLRHNTSALAGGIENVYRVAMRGGLAGRALPRNRHFPRHGVWGLTGDDTGGPSGTLTGAATLRDPGRAVENEIASVLELDHQFAKLLQSAPEIDWIHYTSVNDFVYIAPSPPMARSRYRSSLRLMPFWTEAVPVSNPGSRPIISGLYTGRLDATWWCRSPRP